MCRPDFNLQVLAIILIKLYATGRTEAQNQNTFLGGTPGNLLMDYCMLQL